MNKENFLIELQDVLQTESSLTFDTVLSEIEEWDSLSKISLIAFCDRKFNIKLTFNDVNSLVTVKDIAIKVGLNDIV